jgi:hypothetical protein
MKTLTTADGASITLNDEKITEFRSALRGDLIMDDHAAYESARRVWNGNIDRRPALIARCAGVADVQRAVTFARTPLAQALDSRRRPQRTGLRH